MFLLSCLSIVVVIPGEQVCFARLAAPPLDRASLKPALKLRLEELGQLSCGLRELLVAVRATKVTGDGGSEDRGSGRWTVCARETEDGQVGEPISSLRIRDGDHFDHALGCLRPSK